MPKLVLDFDNTLSTAPKDQKENECKGVPLEGAVDALQFLNDEGYELIISTARHDLIPVRNWLEKHVWSKIDRFDLPVTNTKHHVDRIIDDLAYHFTSWEKTLEDLKDLPND